MSKACLTGFVTPIGLNCSLRLAQGGLVTSTCARHSFCRLSSQRHQKTVRATMGSSSSPSSAAPSKGTDVSSGNAGAPPRQVTYTFLDNNSFVLRYGDTTILVDPWLTGDLVFGTPSFFRSSKPSRPEATNPTRFDPSTASAVVLMQHLPDHAHPPTLKTLPRDLPIIAPNGAKSLLNDLGFKHVTLVEAGDEIKPLEGVSMSIAVGRGSIVGPPWSEPQLALIFTFGTGDDALCIYHEPHGNHDVDFLSRYDGRIDAVLAPIKGSSLPVLANYSLVNGVSEAIELCEIVKPPTCIAFDNSGGDASGFLSKFVKNSGGHQSFEEAVASRSGLNKMRIITASPMKEIVVAGEGVGTTKESSFGAGES